MLWREKPTNPKRSLPFMPSGNSGNETGLWRSRLFNAR